MAERRVFFRQDEAHDFFVIHRDQTFRARLRQEMFQHRFRVCDSGRKTLLVQLEKSRKILGIGLADGDAHGPDSSVR